MPGASVSNPPLAGNNFSPAPRESERGSWLPGLLAGIVLSAVCVAAAWWLGAISLGAAPEVNPRSAEFERRFAVLVPQVKVATTFLDQVEKEVVKLQKDPKIVAAAGKRLVDLSKISPKLAAALPKTLPAGSRIMVRADRRNYKIVYWSTLCSTVQFARPDLVDAVRANAGLGCMYFGKWTAGGKAF